MLDHYISPGSHESNACITELFQLELSDMIGIFSAVLVLQRPPQKDNRN